MTLRDIYHMLPAWLWYIVFFALFIDFTIIFCGWLPLKILEVLDMVLSKSLYQWLKWLVIIVLPALATFIVVISKIWGWADLGTMIAQTITALATFLGTILCISNYNYYKKEDPKE